MSMPSRTLPSWLLLLPPLRCARNGRATAEVLSLGDSRPPPFGEPRPLLLERVEPALPRRGLVDRLAPIPSIPSGGVAPALPGERAELLGVDLAEPGPGGLRLRLRVPVDVSSWWKARQ